MPKSKPADKVFNLEKGLKMNPNEMQGREQEPQLEADSCPTCALDKIDWKGNRGRGYKQAGEIYCCQGCADGSGCTCNEDEQALSDDL